MLQTVKNSFKVAGARMALACVAAKATMTKKSDAINQVVIIVIILAVGIAGVLLYKGFADGIIQKVFTNVGKVIDDLFKTT